MPERMDAALSCDACVFFGPLIRMLDGPYGDVVVGVSPVKEPACWPIGFPVPFELLKASVRKNGVAVLPALGVTDADTHGISDNIMHLQVYQFTDTEP